MGTGELLTRRNGGFQSYGSNYLCIKDFDYFKFSGNMVLLLAISKECMLLVLEIHIMCAEI